MRTGRACSPADNEPVPSDPADEPLAAAVDELYGADPEAFLDRRTALVKQARADGAGAVAKQIAALRKPTRSAAAINRLSRTDPAAIGRLLDLGEQWRAAEKTVDAQQIRELTRRRRRLIDDLAQAAFTAADESNPSSAVRDELVATLTAALSDETVAGEVERGVLVKPARWEGFGIGGPELTLVTGGSSGSTAGRPTHQPAGARPSAGAHPSAGPATPRARPTPAERRATREAEQQAQAERAARAELEAAKAREAAVAAARQAVDEAEDNLVLATDTEQARVDRVRELEEDLAGARRAVDEARREVRRAEIAQRRARDALRRLEPDS